MTYDQLINHFGTQLTAARAIAVSQPAMSNWKARGRIPLVQQLRIEVLTKGKLKAEPLFPKTKSKVSRP
jgi:DNA-binding transcriptional regulator YdaS (Cro superfamily)